MEEIARLHVELGSVQMSNNTIAELFNVRSHDPSFFSVKESAVYKGPLLDFCILVSHWAGMEFDSVMRP